MSLSLLLIYLVSQFGICIYVSKKIQNQEDFLIAGRSLGTPLISLSLFATWFGAETCIGSSAEVFKSGLSGSRADPFGYCICLILIGLFIAPKIWNKEYLTLADLYAAKFGKNTEKLAVCILSLSALIWAAAQLRAFGQVVSSTTHIPVDLAMFLSFVFVVGYVIYGGLLGDIITDGIQAIVISLGLMTLFYFIFKSTPDFLTLLSEQTTDRLSFISKEESLFERMDRWSIPIFGSLVTQELISRILASKSSKVAVRSSYIAALIYILIGSLPVILGLIGPEIISIKDGSEEQFIILLSKKYLPAVLMPIFSGALISALLATIDSILIAVSGLLSHNFLIPKLGIKNEKAKVLTSRVVVIAAATVAYLLAIFSDSIYSLLEIASAYGTSGILVVTLFGLWTKPHKDSIGLATLIVGVICTPLYEYVFKFEAPFLCSVITCLIFFLVRLITENHRQTSHPV